MEESLAVVIGTLNSQYIHSSLAPWCLLAGVRAFGDPGLCARVVEGTINEPPERMLERLVAAAPAAVGFCCYIWNITQTLALLAPLQKRLPGLRIILGGPEVSYCAAAVLEACPAVDFVLSGEGERPFALLLNALLRHEPPAGLPGVCLRTADGIFCAPPYTPDDTPPSPYGPDYFSALSGRIAYLETSRGCPFSCAFCLSGRCGGARFFPLERARRELLLLANSGAKTVKLVDRTFNANPERARAIFRFLLEHYGSDIPQGVCFHFEIAGDLLDDETLALLAAAPPGAIQMEIGLQS
ncbi:MAG: radical SAM protein, partial [Oscillospiraceae bacterium]